MSTAELKNDLHKYIVETEDLSTLQKMKDLFQELVDKESTGFELNPLEEKMLRIGIEQADNGLLTSNDAVQSDINNWIKENQK